MSDSGEGVKQALTIYPGRVDLADRYIRDSIEFLDRYQIVRDSDYGNSRSFDAKAFVDLRLSVECALKAVFALRAPLQSCGEELVQSVEKFSHGIGKLAVAALKDLPVSEAILADLAKLEGVGVAVRYSMDVTELWDHDYEKYRNSIGSEPWRARLEKFARQVQERVVRLLDRLQGRGKGTTRDAVDAAFNLLERRQSADPVSRAFRRKKC